MKRKILTLVLAATTATMLAGCGRGEVSERPPDADNGFIA